MSEHHIIANTDGTATCARCGAKLPSAEFDEVKKHRCLSLVRRVSFEAGEEVNEEQEDR